MKARFSNTITKLPTVVKSMVLKASTWSENMASQYRVKIAESTKKRLIGKVKILLHQECAVTQDSSTPRSQSWKPAISFYS